MSTMGSQPAALEIVSAFGHGLQSHFLMDLDYRNLNHGSFGTIPRAIQAKMREYQDRAEARPDPFILYEYFDLLEQSQSAVAMLLEAPRETVVFVSNASMGVNTILRNMVWDADLKDEILHFDTIYGGCGNTVDYMVESSYGRVSSRVIHLSYPCEDSEIVTAFQDAVQASIRDGKRPRICIFDVVTSVPGVRFPFEAVTAACKEAGILSLIDGAQGIGMVGLNLSRTDPDFFVSNCHKWLHVPRGCAVLYVPLRNQHLMRSPLPTSHGFISKPRPGQPVAQRNAPVPMKSPSHFLNNFNFVGTLDNSPYLCVKDSIQWRHDVLGGEDRILAYQRDLARKGGRLVAEALGTWVLDNEAGTLTECAMVNIPLPFGIVPDGTVSDEDRKRVGSRGENDEQVHYVIPREHATKVTAWIKQTLMDEYNTFIMIYTYHDRWFARISAQVYLDEDDFRWAGMTLRAVSERVVRERPMCS
ncbi:Pyridoxal phosphate-dependent transferase [Rhypophila decipiens]